MKRKQKLKISRNKKTNIKKFAPKAPSVLSVKAKKSSRKALECLKRVREFFPEAHIMSHKPEEIVILGGLHHLNICLETQCYVLRINGVLICFSEYFEEILNVLKAIKECKR